MFKWLKLKIQITSLVVSILETIARDYKYGEARKTYGIEADRLISDIKTLLVSRTIDYINRQHFYDMNKIDRKVEERLKKFEAYLSSEEFIDKFVEKINKKQLKK